MPMIVLNGETREVDAGCSVRQMLDAAGYADRRVAVEINRQIVPRSRHADTELREGDRIEVVHALGGG